MPFDLFRRMREAPKPPEALLLGGAAVPVALVRNPRARRYILRVQPDGSIRVTVPARGSQAEAWAFVRRQRPWIENALRQPRPALPVAWAHGTVILYRGEPVALSITGEQAGSVVEFAGERVTLPVTTDVRCAVERYLWNLARRELPVRTLALAAQHQLVVHRVTVRNQRSRWGSSSRRGTISLNWRLIQTPEFVRDYIIWHELMHLREHNHSARFWQQVAQVCPDYERAERWLKQHRGMLR
jgi:predicted metal-dependent hydrolase